MDTIHIDKLLFPIGNGATNPIYGTSNDKNYIIKTINNIEGNKVLINELICYLIAKKLKFPIPNACFGEIDSNTLIHKNVLDSKDFDSNCFGLAFCSEFINSAMTISSSKMITSTNNYKWLLPKLMLFDHLIYNKDRNKGNLLISYSKKDKNLYVIDHSHTFNLEALWNSVGLKQKIIDEDFKDNSIMDSNQYLYSKFNSALKIDMITMQETIKYFKENLNVDFFKSLVENVPKVWENDKDELDALTNYLIYRMEHIDYFADLIINNIVRR